MAETGQQRDRNTELRGGRHVFFLLPVLPQQRICGTGYIGRLSHSALRLGIEETFHCIANAMMNQIALRGKNEKGVEKIQDLGDHLSLQ